MNEPVASSPPAPTALTIEPDPDPAAVAPGPGPDEWIGLLHRAADGAYGLDVIYDLLELVAARFALDDLIVAVTNETLGPQAFRLGRRPIGSDGRELLDSGPGLIAAPRAVPPGAQRLVLGLVEVVLTTELARRHVIRDPSTGLLSLPVFNETLRSAAAQSARHGWSFTVLLLEIDAGGHPERPAELQRLGRSLGRVLRTGDAGTHLRRSTFTALLPNATRESLDDLVGRFREESGLADGALRYASAITPQDSVDAAELLRLASSRLRDG